MTINLHYVTCLSIIGGVTTEAITSTGDQSSSVSLFLCRVTPNVSLYAPLFQPLYLILFCYKYKLWCNAVKQIFFKQIFGAFSDIYAVTVMKINSQNCIFTHYKKKKGISLCVKSRCCSTCIALTQCVFATAIPQTDME